MSTAIEDFLKLLLSQRILPLQLILFSFFLFGFQHSNKNKEGLNSLFVNQRVNSEFEGLPLYWWQQRDFVNFGDKLSLVLVERIVNSPVKTHRRWPPTSAKVLLAIGSILSFAKNNDVIWGTGVNGKVLDKSNYNFSTLDVRAVRGPFTRNFLWENFQIESPAIYGDPALLFPYFFPEFKKQQHPKYPYIIIPHFTEEKIFPRDLYPNVVYPTDPWEDVIAQILDSQFVISSSLHGIIIAEAYGIPARLLRITENEPLLKFKDYYSGTNRSDFTYATSIEEALQMGGERPFVCDLQKLYDAFPFEAWPNATYKGIDFIKNSNCIFR